MVDQQEDQNSGQVSTNPSVTPAETDNQTPGDKLDKKESSSSSSTSSENIDEDDFFQIEGPILGSTISFGGNAAIEGIRQQSGSPSQHESNAPTVQAMSRAPDEHPDPKRIPSSVFARSKSTTPTDWSVTSNESLFSINVGNASFSKDHFFLYGKTGELSNLNDPLAPLPPLPRPSLSSSPMRSEAAKTTAQAPSAKLKPVTRDGDNEGGDDTDYNHSLSHRSDASTTSFAFPILAGDVRSSGSLKDDPPELPRQSTSQQAEPLVQQQEATKVEAKAPEAEQAPAPEPTPVPAPAQASAPESAPQQPAAAKWFPCCSCCPFCC